MDQSNTAADRLLRIVNGVAVTSNHEFVFTAWAKALEIPAQDRIQLLRGIVTMSELVDEVESTVCRHGGPATKLYQRSLSGVRSLLSTNLDKRRHEMTELTPQLINDLEHCAATYSLIDREISVSRAEVDSVKSGIDELFRDIGASKLPEGLRLQLLDLLELMRQQVAQYEIRGAEALRECLRYAVARLAEIYPAIQEHQSEPLLKRLAGIFSHIGTICESARKALPILKVAAKLLPLFTSNPSVTAIPETVDVEVITGDGK